jgi:hypothetical protein
MRRVVGSCEGSVEVTCPISQTSLSQSKAAASTHPEPSAALSWLYLCCVYEVKGC